MTIHSMHIQRCIGIAFPTTTQIEFIVNTRYAETARNSQPQRIILTITGIRETNLSQHRSVESTRRAQTIDA